MKSLVVLLIACTVAIAIAGDCYCNGPRPADKRCADGRSSVATCTSSGSGKCSWAYPSCGYNGNNRPIGCSKEARLCPDGTAIGRDPKRNCAFPKCNCTAEDGTTVAHGDDYVLCPNTCSCNDGVLECEPVRCRAAPRCGKNYQLISKPIKGSCCYDYHCQKINEQPPSPICNKACIQPPKCEYGEPVASGSCCPTYTCPPPPVIVDPPVCTKACIKPPTCEYGEPVASGSCCPTYTCPPPPVIVDPPPPVCTKACIKPPTCEFGDPLASGSCCPTYKCPACRGEGSFCGGIAGIQCPSGTECVDNPNDSCDPTRGGADCGGICACSTPPACEGEGKFCGGIAGIPCATGSHCIDDPNDSCDPNNGGADCGGICACGPEPACPGENMFCGGFANIQCPSGSQCVDDPNDGCDPKNGGADCGGICQCSKPQQCEGEGAFCGGFGGFPCPSGSQCFDDPSDDCDPRNGGADCGGICVCDGQTPACPVNEVWRECGTCERQCGDDQSIICTRECKPAGCYCLGDGLVRGPDGSCIQEYTCPANHQCDAPFQWTECGSLCDTCTHVTEQLLCPALCVAKCACPVGQVLDERINQCVDPSQCVAGPDCRTIKCSAGFHCENGLGCVADVTDPSCAAVTCLTGSECINGRCVPISSGPDCSLIRCRSGFHCENGVGCVEDQIDPCAAVLCKTGSTCVDGRCIANSGPDCRLIRCASGYTCIDGKGCVKNDPTCDDITCDVEGQVCKMVNAPSCYGAKCKQVPRCECPACQNACPIGKCLPWQDCRVSAKSSTACSCPTSTCVDKPRPKCKTNYRPVCDPVGDSCWYDDSLSVMDANGCPLRCPNVVCCAMPPCAAPPEGCNYDFSQAPRDSHGCQIGCGSLICGPGAGLP